VHEPQDSGDITSSLIDLDAVGVVDLAMLGDSALAGVLRTIQAEASRPDEAVAGFTSSL
jgi:FXSXX-COOH protein